MSFVKNHPVVVLFILLLFTLAGLTANTYFKKSATDRRGFGGTPVVITEAASTTVLIDQVEAIGTARARESVNLTSKVTDTVRKVNFEDGAYVEEGTILVELTNTEETAQLAEAQSNLTETSRQLERIQNLIHQGLASELRLDEEKSRQQTASARLDAIVARLDDQLIRAPFSGILGFRNVSPGTLLSPNIIVTTLDDISLIKLDFSVPENYLSALKPGQQVFAVSAAYEGRQFEGTVKTINSRIDPVTRSVTVRAHIDNMDRQLKPGMLLTVTLIRSRSEALVVPEEAVIPVQEHQFVYVVTKEGIAKQTEIKTGRRKPGIVEVLSGLEPGQEVITQGVIKVRPGSKVIVKGRESADPAPPKPNSKKERPGGRP